MEKWEKMKDEDGSSPKWKQMIIELIPFKRAKTKKSKGKKRTIKPERFFVNAEGNQIKAPTCDSIYQIMLLILETPTRDSIH